MMAEWYFQRDGEEVGPLTTEALKKFAMKGVITPATKVRKGTEDKWHAAQKFKGLVFETAASTSPQEKPATKKDTTSNAELGALEFECVKHPIKEIMDASWGYLPGKLAIALVAVPVMTFMLFAMMLFMGNKLGWLPQKPPGKTLLLLLSSGFLVTCGALAMLWWYWSSYSKMIQIRVHENGLAIQTWSLFSGKVEHKFPFHDISEVYFGEKSAILSTAFKVGGRRTALARAAVRQRLTIERTDGTWVRIPTVDRYFDRDSISKAFAGWSDQPISEYSQ